MRSIYPAVIDPEVTAVLRAKDTAILDPELARVPRAADPAVLNPEPSAVTRPQDIAVVNPISGVHLLFYAALFYPENIRF